MTEEHFETVTRILDPITRMLEDTPLGATAADIALIETEYGLERLPATVEAFLTVVGRDEALVQVMFAGDERFDVGTLLGDARGGLRSAAELGAPELMLRGGLPYTGAAEYQSWLGGPDRALTVEDEDPQIWTIVEDGSLHRGEVFTTDLAIRVEWGLRGLSSLRQRVDSGFPDPIAQKATEILGEQRYTKLKQGADERMRAQLPADLVERLETATQQRRLRDIELRNRLVD